jgi:signal transduction histidine kinase
VVAALFIHSLEPNAFTSRDVEVADRVGTQIAGPVGGSLLREREFELNVQRIALSEERVRRRSAELEAKALAEANEIKSNFVSAMSHELRTPLTSIIAFSDLLTREDSTNVTGRELQQMNVIKRNARHLESMINDLLDLTIVDRGRMEIANHEFDFIQMARDTIESLKKNPRRSDSYPRMTLR